MIFVARDDWPTAHVPRGTSNAPGIDYLDDELQKRPTAERPLAAA